MGFIPFIDVPLPIGVPLFIWQFDRHPAQEPYDITGMK